MVVYKPTALLILFGICAVRANVILPRKHVLDFVTFRDNVPTPGEYPWKSMWEFTSAFDNLVDAQFGAVFSFRITKGGAFSALYSLYNLNTDSCANSVLYSGYPKDGDRAVFRSSSANYLGFFSSDPSKYLWFYECFMVTNTGDCSEDSLTIRLLFNQGTTFNRPEGLPWAQILKDLYQATKLNLDTVTSTDFGTFRAKYVYKDYNDSIC